MKGLKLLKYLRVGDHFIRRVHLALALVMLDILIFTAAAGASHQTNLLCSVSLDSSTESLSTSQHRYLLVV